MMKHVYRVEGMHCESCVAKIADAIDQIEDVSSVSITLDPPRADVAMKQHVPLERLNEAVGKHGNYKLIEQPQEQPHPMQEAGGSQSTPESLFPLFLIVGYILGGVILIAFATGQWEVRPMMRHFMAAFFLVFSFFKLLDLPGFVSAYRGYDLLGKRSAAYAYSYPFIELGLGVAYLLNVYPVVVNTVTLALMLLGAAGVLRALLRKQTIRCACLGTALNLPMTKVTLVEDLTMAAMAALMLIMYAA